MTAEISRSTGIDNQKHCHFPLLDELFDKRMPHPSRHIPIDGPDFIPSLVFPEIFKVDALPLETTVVLAAEAFPHEAAGPKFDLADFSENFGDFCHREGKMRGISSLANGTLRENKKPHPGGPERGFEIRIDPGRTYSAVSASASAATGATEKSTHSMKAMGAESVWRGPSLVMRV